MGRAARRPEHPYRVTSLDRLADGLRQLAVEALPSWEQVRSIFVIPEQLLSRDWSGKGGLKEVPEQALIFTTQGVLHVQAGDGEAEFGQAKYLAGEHLLYARLIIVLIYGRIELHGVVEGQRVEIVAEYNSVSQELLQPELYHLLRLAWKPVQEESRFPNKTMLLLNNLDQESVKFYSGLNHYSLQKDEQLKGYVYQPCIQKKKFGFIRHKVAPASLVALTDRQWILIEEGLTSATSYGYFIHYYPLANVMKFELKANETLQLSDLLKDVWISFEKNGVRGDHYLTMENDYALACERLWSEASE